MFSNRLEISERKSPNKQQRFAVWAGSFSVSQKNSSITLEQVSWNRVNKNKQQIRDFPHLAIFDEIAWK